MRNALVLVPLCIGLTSGFIAPTSTSEANRLPQNMITVIRATDEGNRKNISIDLDAQLPDIKEDDVKQELYNEGSEENKTIEERSFILVNQRWSKQPYKSHLSDTKLSNSIVNSRNFKKASFLNVFQEDPRENIISHIDNGHKKYLKDKHDLKDKHEHYMEYNRTRNKIYFTTIRTTESKSKIHSNRGSNLKDHIEYKESMNHNHFIELLKTSFIRPSIRNYGHEASDENVKNKHSNHANKNHFMDFNKENYNVQAYKNKEHKITDQNRERNKNTPFYKGKIKQLLNESYVEIVSQPKLFHMLLEEEVPLKQVIYKHNNSTLGNFKYCRKCARLAKLSNQVTQECDCKCGRYIHLKGRTEPKN